MPRSEPSVGYLIYSTGRRLRWLADRRLKPLGLSSAHLPIITALIEHGEMSQKALTEQVGIEQPTMAATLARMERDGIVRRRPNPLDGRAAIISLTPRSIDRIDAIQQVVRTISEDALRGLAKKQRKEFRQIMTAVQSSLDELADGDEAPGK